MVMGENEEVGCLWFVEWELWFVLCGLWFVRLCFVVCDLYNNKGFIHWVILLIGWTGSLLVGGYPCSLLSPLLLLLPLLLL